MQFKPNPIGFSIGRCSGAGDWRGGTWTDWDLNTLLSVHDSTAITKNMLVLTWSGGGGEGERRYLLGR